MKENETVINVPEEQSALGRELEERRRNLTRYARGAARGSWGRQEGLSELREARREHKAWKKQLEANQLPEEDVIVDLTGETPVGE